MNEEERKLYEKEREKKQNEWEARLRERELKQKKWEERANKSNDHADYLVKLASSAEPVGDTAIGDLLLTVFTGGLYAIAESLKSPKEILNEKMSYLQSCSKKLKEAREYFQSHKIDMIAEDKNRAYSAISSANEKLKSAWAEFNDQKQKAWESYKRAKEEKAREYEAKRAAWEERQRIKAEKQRLYEEKQKAWEERQKIRAEKQREWELRKADRERKQKEWEERQKERERKQREWEARKLERERRQQEWEERNRERERKHREWEQIQQERARERERRREEYEERKRNRGSGRRKGSGGCFITTAVCLSLNKPDDCIELSMMRMFRDNWLVNQKNGINIIEEYYRIAPLIVEEINACHDNAQIYKHIWEIYLYPFFKLISSGNNRKAKSVYLKMVYQLANKYLKLNEYKIIYNC